MVRRTWGLRLGWLVLVAFFLVTAVVLGACDDKGHQDGTVISQVSLPKEGTVWTWAIPTPSPTPRSYMCDCILTQIPTPLLQATTPVP